MSTLVAKLLFTGCICAVIAVGFFAAIPVSCFRQRKQYGKHPHPGIKKKNKKAFRTAHRTRIGFAVTGAILLAAAIGLCAPAGVHFYRQWRADKQTAEEAQAFNASLGFACMNKDVGKVGELLIGGADANEIRADWSPLMYACQYDDTYENENAVEIVQTLIDHGADVNYADEHGYTALMYAAENDALLDAARVLVENGADVNARAGDMTALSSAAFHGAENMVNLLLQSKARVDGDYNPLPSAVYPDGYAKYGVIRALVDAGAATDITVPMTDGDGKKQSYTLAQCIDMDEADYIENGYPSFVFDENSMPWDENYAKIRAIPGFYVTNS